MKKLFTILVFGLFLGQSCVDCEYCKIVVRDANGNIDENKTDEDVNEYCGVDLNGVNSKDTVYNPEGGYSTYECE